MGFYGFARFGYAGDGIVGDVGFDSAYADAFWRRDGHPGPSYSFAATSYVIPDGLIDRAKAQWQHLQDIIDAGAPSSARAQSRMAQLRSDVAGYVAPVEAMVTRKFDFERDTIAASQAVGYFRAINGELSKFAAESWPDPNEEIDAAQTAAVAAQAKAVADAAALAAAQKKAVADLATAKAKVSQTQGDIAAAQAAIADAAHAKQAAQAAGVAHKAAAATAVEKRAALKTPLTIAAIAVPAAIVAAFVLLKRGKKSVAGYRRRRRR